VLRSAGLVAAFAPRFFLWVHMVVVFDHGVPLFGSPPNFSAFFGLLLPI